MAPKKDRTTLQQKAKTLFNLKVNKPPRPHRTLSIDNLLQQSLAESINSSSYPVFASESATARMTIQCHPIIADPKGEVVSVADSTKSTGSDDTITPSTPGAFARTLEDPFTDEHAIGANNILSPPVVGAVAVRPRARINGGRHFKTRFGALDLSDDPVTDVAPSRRDRATQANRLQKYHETLFNDNGDEEVGESSSANQKAKVAANGHCSPNEMTNPALDDDSDEFAEYGFTPAFINSPLYHANKGKGKGKAVEQGGDAAEGEDTYGARGFSPYVDSKDDDDAAEPKVKVDKGKGKDPEMYRHASNDENDSYDATAPKVLLNKGKGKDPELYGHANDEMGVEAAAMEGATAVTPTKTNSYPTTLPPLENPFDVDDAEEWVKVGNANLKKPRGNVSSWRSEASNSASPSSNKTFDSVDSSFEDSSTRLFTPTSSNSRSSGSSGGSNSGISDAEEIRRRELRFAAQEAMKLEDLRMRTGSQHCYAPPGFPLSSQDQHPRHGRDFYSKNLWCLKCEGFCALCENACCAYLTCVTTFKESSSLPHERVVASRLIKEIVGIVKAGIDQPTFLQCTDCKKMVCPRCIGVCPVYPCHDHVCTKCKKNPWAPCEWHGLKGLLKG